MHRNPSFDKWDEPDFPFSDLDGFDSVKQATKNMKKAATLRSKDNTSES